MVMSSIASTEGSDNIQNGAAAKTRNHAVRNHLKYDFLYSPLACEPLIWVLCHDTHCDSFCEWLDIRVTLYSGRHWFES